MKEAIDLVQYFLPEAQMYPIGI